MSPDQDRRSLQDAAACSAAAPKRVTILGATGSVGVSTLDLISRMGGEVEIVALTAHRNVEGLARQALAFRPKLAVVGDPACYAALKEALSGSGIDVAAGEEALCEAAERPCDWTMAAIVGSAGLAPTLAAARQGKILALANKESLVCAGDLLLNIVRKAGALLLPVDSEHNAIFQVLDAQRKSRVARLILTASGGPFRTFTRAQMEGVTPKQAVKHPNWDMGAKISIDSATMMNKGLELIEACHLFAMPEDKIEVLIHPQSVVHSLVGYVDGSVLAQLGEPDMRTPIAYALAWPDRMPVPVKSLNLADVGALTFQAPDHDRFPALALARNALRAGGFAPIYLNAANEVAVAAFLAGEIGFLRIASLVEAVLGDVPTGEVGSIDAVNHADQAARQKAKALVARAH